VPERQVLAWLQPNKPQLFQPSNFPVFNCLVPEGRFYGFPVHGVPGFKFGKYHHFEETGHPDRLIVNDNEPRPEDEIMLRDFASRYFPDGTGPTMTLATCMFTNTPDGHFIIDQHPQLPQVFYASPCSGHGYKFASVIGEIMADLGERGETRWDIGLFRADRLGVQTSAMWRDKDQPMRHSLGDRHKQTSPPTPLVLEEGREDTTNPHYWQRQAVTPFW
jgi:sarcosine oxidase